MIQAAHYYQHNVHFVMYLGGKQKIRGPFRNPPFSGDLLEALKVPLDPQL